MGIEANNVIEAKKLSRHRTQKASVQSLVRLQTPPDTLSLTASLQTTLGLKELMLLFQSELKEYVDFDGLSYRNADHGVVLQQGNQGLHQTNYGLHLHEEMLGEINLSRNTPFSEKDLAIIEHLLVPLLYPLRNGLRYHAALAAAYRDPLTGVSNRTAMEDALPREVERSVRHNTALTMLVLDLDHFKAVNDHYGHTAGDCVLRCTARSIRNCLRTVDHIYRYGGEEFVILLPDTDHKGAMIVAERIRSEIENGSCQCDGESIQITASIGLAELTQGDSQHTLFDKADRAVYHAKKEGRNRVVEYRD